MSTISASTTTTTAYQVSADTTGALVFQTGSTPTTGLTIDTGQRSKFPTTIGVGGATPSTSGSGISFPATQSASSDANTLDDYEEGTWTPSVGGNATYNEQVGYYTKIGNFVKLRFHINVNVLGTGSTTTITGIPFTPAGNSPSITGGVVCYANTLATSVLSLGVYCQNTANIYFFTRNSSSTGATTQQPAVIGNNFDAYCEISYLV